MWIRFSESFNKLGLGGFGVEFDFWEEDNKVAFESVKVGEEVWRWRQRCMSMRE